MAAQDPKIAVAERLMTRPQGATMDEILAETGGSFQYNAKRRLEARGYVVKTRREGRSLRYFAMRPQTRTFDLAVTSKGQVTIPKEVRARLGLRTGGEVRLVQEDDGRVVLMPADLSVRRLFGILGSPPRAATLDEMDRGVRDAVVKRYLRSTP